VIRHQSVDGLDEKFDITYHRAISTKFGTIKALVWPRFEIMYRNITLVRFGWVFFVFLLFETKLENGQELWSSSEWF